MAKLDLFGKHKRQIWQELCKRIDADYFKGKWNKPERIEAFHGNWVITIDTFMVDKVVFSRIRAPYVNRDDFKFRIYREKFHHRIGKKLGLQDVIVGHTQFDREFVIQGNDERKLQMMFENPHIRNLISYQPSIYLEVRHNAPLFSKKFPKDVNEVYFHVSGVLKDIDQLHDLYDLFGFTLDHLCNIGTAYEDDPGFLYY